MHLTLTLVASRNVTIKVTVRGGGYSVLVGIRYIGRKYVESIPKTRTVKKWWEDASNPSFPKYMLKRKIMSFNLHWPYVDFVPG